MSHLPLSERRSCRQPTCITDHRCRSATGELLDATRPPPNSAANAGQADPPAAGSTAHTPPLGRSMLDGFMGRSTQGDLGRDARVRPRGKPKPAPVPVPDGAEFVHRTFRGSAGRLDYKLYMPARRADGPLPLLVMLHGCTQTPDDFAAGTRMNALAEEHGLLVVYPEQTMAANAQKCWNWFKPADQQRDQANLPSSPASRSRCCAISPLTGAGLRRRPVSGRRSRGDHGAGLSRCLCRSWRSFRASLRCGARHPDRICGNAPRRGPWSVRQLHRQGGRHSR